jgi:hypothetical protein
MRIFFRRNGMEKTTLSIYQIVGNEICVEADDGVKVYDKIKVFLVQKKPVILSFLNVKMLTSAFLNTAIGQLYKDNSENDIKSLLSVKDLSSDYVQLLERVVKNAKQFYENPEKMEKSIQEALNAETAK